MNKNCKPKKKEFKTFTQQVKLLESKNFNVKNQSRLLSYLKLYNYQIFINGYNDPFMKNFQRINDVYQDNVSEDSIIDLFNFDRTIRHILLSNIQNIERKFSTMLTYIIGEQLFLNGCKNGEILKFENFDKIFVCSCLDDELNESLCKKFSKIKSGLTEKYIRKDDASSILNVPIWALSVYWTFGDTVAIFDKLNHALKIKILDSAFSKIFLCDREFLIVIHLLRDIRNRICHNNVLYNTRVRNEAGKLKEFLLRHGKKASNKIAICDVVNIIDIILSDSKPQLKIIFDGKVKDKILSSKNISDVAKDNILSKMNFDKNV